MKRILTATLAFATATGVLFAETLTPEEALARLSSPSGAMRAPLHLSTAPVLVNTTKGGDGEAAVYLFDRNSDGFIIVSADDTTEPLLAYSDAGSVGNGDIPPQLQWWLEEYARQIQYNKEHGALYIPRRALQREAIAPMITTDWDQGAPYNMQCPMSGTDRTYTGCVATAMAQVLNYWKYPERGKGSISYNATTLQKRLTLNFSRQTIDWDNMLPKYTEGSYTEAQANAVAYLMKACGYSVKMDYGLDSSGALAMNIANALITYFNYDPNIRYELRQYHTTSEWTDLLYDNLKNVGPILYGGGSLLGGGHSFICDGYDGNGYFHFNWGWTGMSNGYFSVDALNPYSLGAGGGAGGGYNFTQDAVLGIQPPTGEPAITETPVLTQTGSLAAGIDGDDLVFDLFAAGDASWVNYNPKTLEIFFAALFQSESDPACEDFYVRLNDKAIDVEPGYGVMPSGLKPTINLPTAGIPDGRYKVTMCNSHADTPDEWIPVKTNTGYFNHIHLTKKGTEYTIENNDVDRLEVVDGEIIGNLYYGTAATVRITVGNGSDHEMSSGFAPALAYNGQVVMLGESILLTVAPGETVTREWTTVLNSLSQNFVVDNDTEMYFTFFDEGNYNFYGDDITKRVIMKANPGAPTMSLVRRPAIDGARQIFDLQAGGIIYEVNDASEMNVSTTVRLERGYFGYPLYAFVASPVEGDETRMAIETYAGEVKIIDTEGQTAELETTVNFPAAIPGRNYFLMVGYAYGSDFVPIGPGYSVFRLKSSGIDNVISDNTIEYDGSTVTVPGCIIEILNMQGITVATGRDILGTDGIAPGVYIVRAADKSLKITIK